jgi:uncharacterized protein
LDLTPLIPGGRQIIESYGDGRFRVGGQVYAGALLVFPTRSLTWAITEAAEASLENLAEVLEAGRNGEVDLLLLGQGRRMLPVAPALRQGLKSVGVVVEPMDTGAACRTYNVLMAEGRLVAAALIAVS